MTDLKVKASSPRGIKECRVCRGSNLFEILDLGEQPLPAEYGLTSQTILDEFPLKLSICKDCGLGQLGEYVLPERIFHEKYPYISSASSTWLNHAKKYASKMSKELSLNENSFVIELASNDGCVLNEFRKLGSKVLGVEPALNIAKLANKSGIETISEFFGESLAQNILEKYGSPNLIAANNVFAHVPNMHDFTKGMSILANNKTVITIENPSFINLLNENLFDTIYHEHYSYLTAHSVKAIANQYGLELFHVEKLPTHGGSNRYFLSKSKEMDNCVLDLLKEEKEKGLFSSDEWVDFKIRAQNSIIGLREWLLERKINGDVVAGYGAAHKGNTFLNSVGELSKTLVYVVDASPEKQGKFLPGSQVEVLAPNQLASKKPTDILILPWNISKEIAKNIRNFTPNARIWVAHPEMRQL